MVLSLGVIVPAVLKLLHKIKMLTGLLSQYENRSFLMSLMPALVVIVCLYNALSLVFTDTLFPDLHARNITLLTRLSTHLSPLPSSSGTSFSSYIPSGARCCCVILFSDSSYISHYPSIFLLYSIQDEMKAEMKKITC